MLSPPILSSQLAQYVLTNLYHVPLFLCLVISVYIAYVCNGFHHQKQVIKTVCISLLYNTPGIPHHYNLKGKQLAR